MSSLVLEIEDLELVAGQRAYIDRVATYFLLMVGSDVDVEWYSKGSRIGGAVGLQGGDAVGPLSQAYDRVVLTSATTQTVKVATSSDPVTITRLSGTVTIAGVVETAPDYSRVQNESSFFAATTRTAVTGEFSYLQLWNEAGSGVDLVVPSMYVRAPSGSSALFFITDIKLESPSFNNVVAKEAFLMKAQSPVVVSASEVARSGSSAETAKLRSAANDSGTIETGWMDLKQPFVLTPGTGLGFQGRAYNEELAISAQLFEVPR